MALDARIPLMYRGMGLEPRSNALMRAGEMAGMQQRQEMNALQMAQMKAAAEDAMRQKQAQEQQRQQMDAALASIQPVSPINANRVSGVSGPRPEALSVVGQRPPVDPLALLRAGFDPKMVEFIVNSPNLGRAEVARVLERAGANGRPESVQLDKFGQPVGSAMPKAVESKVMDLGGKKQAYDPYGLKPGQEFQTTMTPEGRDASARGWAGVKLSRERLEFDKSQVAPGGKPSAAQERANIEQAKAGRQGEQMLSAIEEARSLLGKNPTASGIGAAADMAGRFFGATTESAKTAAQLETLSGWMVANVPRMEGPQSNFDVDNYKVMAAKVGDRSTPVEERLAALSTLEDLHRKYADINGTPLPPSKAKIDPKALMTEADRIIGIRR